MEMLTPVAAGHHTRIRIASHRSTEFIDLTDDLRRLVTSAGIRNGIVNVQSLHTTAAIVVNEHEPLLLADFESFLEGVAPQAAAYRHDDTHTRTVNVMAGERPNGHAHCRALLLPSSVSLNVADGELVLGVWQRVFMVELDGPRHREISVTVVGETVA
jgi:secondary thiamine-phosphate synthase enzyme